MSKKPQLSLLSVGVSVATLLLASTTSFAATAYKGETFKGEPAPCPVECMLKSGFYVGAQVGYDMYRIRDDIDAGDGFGNTIDTDPALNANGWAGGLFLGYGMYWDNFYLGAEIFGNASGAKSDFDTTLVDEFGDVLEIDHDVKVKSEYGISLLPGVKINNCALFYLRVGYNWAKIDNDIDLTYTDAFDSDFNFSVGGDESKTVHGWSGGLGIEAALADNWSVRTEYTYTSYNNVDNDNDDDDDNSSDSDLKISNNQFMVSLIYHIS